MLPLYTLETERLWLRRITPLDINTFFTTLSKADCMHNLGVQSDEDYDREKHRWEKGYETFSRKLVFFQLTLKDSDVYIGNCGFHSWAFDHHRAEVYYFLNDDAHKQKGYMKEALAAVLNYGLTQMNLQRIEGVIADDNLPSKKLLQHFGFVKEATMRRHYMVNGVLEDSDLYAYVVIPGI